MSAWFGKLVSRRREAAIVRAIAQVRLVAFGKHPAWDDHIDDIGLDTEVPVTAKRLLYVRGIGENIDAGAWADLEQEGSAVPFGHNFVWCHQGHTLAGRLWSSRDGRDRSSYPMIVGAYLQALSPIWVCERLLPAFTQLETQCMEADTRAQVHACLDAWQHQVAKLELPERVNDSAPSQPTALANLAAYTEFAPRAEGLVRIFYHICRELGCQPNDAEIVPERPVLVRVPLDRRQSFTQLQMWTSFLSSWLHPDTIFALFLPDNRNWADLYIGDPAPNQIFALRAPPTAVPVTSTIPYNIPLDFARTVRERVGI